MAPRRVRAPLAQQLDFTCGPACLIIALERLLEDYSGGVAEEIQIWREANTVFMGHGHPGCGPHGLALAAARRGARPEVLRSTETTSLAGTVRAARQREIMELVERTFLGELKEAGVPVSVVPFDEWNLEGRRAAGQELIVLASLYRILGEKQPHWMLIERIDSSSVRLLDPWNESGGSRAQRRSVGRAEFARIGKFGANDERALVALSP